MAREDVPIGHPLKEYGRKADNISVNETSEGLLLLLEGEKLIIPKNKRENLLEELHKWHISIEQIMRQARKLWI